MSDLPGFVPTPRDVVRPPSVWRVRCGDALAGAGIMALMVLAVALGHAGSSRLLVYGWNGLLDSQAAVLSACLVGGSALEGVRTAPRTRSETHTKGEWFGMALLICLRLGLLAGVVATMVLPGMADASTSGGGLESWLIWVVQVGVMGLLSALLSLLSGLGPLAAVVWLVALGVSRGGWRWPKRRLDEEE